MHLLSVIFVRKKSVFRWKNVQNDPTKHQIGMFSKKMDLIKFSTGLENSWGCFFSFLFWTTKLLKFSQKNVHVNRISSFENIDGGYPLPEFWGEAP